MKSDDVAELAQTLFEEIGDAAFITDPQTLSVVDVNPMAQRLTGLPRGNLLRLPLNRLFRSDEDENLVNFQRALHTTQTFHSQEGYLLRRSTDSWIPVNLTLTRLHTEAGPMGLVLARDITERMRAEESLRLANAMLERRVQERTSELARLNEILREEITGHLRAATALRNSEDRFRSAFEHTGVAMVLTDLHHRFIRVNHAFARMFGYTPEEILGMTMGEISHPDDLAESYARREALLTGAQTFFQMEKRYIHKQGRTLWALVNVSLVRDPSGHPLLYVGQVQDITERKHSEQVLLQTQQRLTHVIASSPAVLFTLAVEGQRIRGMSWISDNLHEMLGYVPEDAYRADWWLENVHLQDRELLLAEIQDHLFSTGHATYEYRFRHRDRNYRWTRFEIRLVRDTSGEKMEAVGSWSDITERKRLEDLFRQSQKMEAVGRLAGGVAHDFNNLLTVINGYGELILSDLPVGSPGRELIQVMVAAGERAAGLTRQLLAFSRKAIVDPKVLDLATVVTDVERMLRRIVGEDVQLAVAFDPAAGAVKADPGQMEQVILNLVVNARDAMPRGGQLTIEVRNADLDETYAQTHPDARPGPHVLLAVTDTGCGMDEATMALVFEPFFTTKGNHGTGLGLATVHGIVRQSGGHVCIYSEVGRGTTFKVYLPFVDKAQAASRSRPGQSIMPRGTETILLAEDEDGVRAFTRLVLQNCGYTLIEARDGPEAVELAGQYAGRIDMLVTDVVMPRMGGRDLAEHFAQRYPGIKVLFLSGYTDDAVVRHGILEAEVAFLQKPFTPLLLAVKIRDVLDGR